MKKHSLAGALLALIVTPAWSQSRLAGDGTVTGHVYCADSQTPCRFASVVLQTAPPLANGKPGELTGAVNSYSATTDVEGAYQISGVLPGEYYALGKLQGYLSAYDLAMSMYGESSLTAQALEIALTRLDVESGHGTVCNLTLSRGASLSGTLQYDDGAPGINLPVHLFRKNADGTWKLYQNTAGGQPLASLGLELHTDERGQFREAGLPPGTYTVEATLPAVTFAPTAITGNVGLNLHVANGNALRVYEGNKFRLREAVAVELHEGEQYTTANVTLPTHGFHLVQGTVTVGNADQPVSKGTVTMLDPVDKSTLRVAEIQTDGSFSFSYVLAGTYQVVVAGVDHHDEKNQQDFAPLTEELLIETDQLHLHYRLSTRVAEPAS